jgi:hypothetical protein
VAKAHGAAMPDGNVAFVVRREHGAAVGSVSDDQVRHLISTVAPKAYPLSDPLSCYFLAAMISISTRTPGLIN